MRTRTVRGGFGITAGAGAALLAAAALFDGEPLYVPGLALLLAAGGASLWVLIGTIGTVVERSVGVRRAFEDEPVEVVVEARPGITILPGTALDDPLLPSPLALRPSSGIHRVRMEVRFSRRGRRVLPPPALAVGDPLGLVDGRVAGAGADDVLLVLPRIEPVVTAARAGDAGRLGRRRATAGAAETELDGLRPHRSGAPASRIFWPAFARAGELLERRMAPEADARPVVALDARGALSEADLDAAVRACASLAVHLARTGGCGLLLPGDRRPTLLDPPLHGWTQLHVRLALLEGGGGPGVGALAARRGPLVWVSARRVERAPRGLAQAGATSRVLVIPGRLAGRRAAFSVAGCSGYVLTTGELAEVA
jgi:uncharacterized protein (DUF58 family)